MHCAQSPNHSSSELSKSDVSDYSDEEPVLKQARLSNSGNDISFRFGSNNRSLTSAPGGEEIFHFYGATSSQNNSANEDAKTTGKKCEVSNCSRKIVDD